MNMKNMKKFIYCWLVSIVGILLGGMLLCFTQVVPFAVTLLGLSSFIFIAVGLFILSEFGDWD